MLVHLGLDSLFHQALTSFLLTITKMARKILTSGKTFWAALRTILLKTDTQKMILIFHTSQKRGVEFVRIIDQISTPTL